MKLNKSYRIIALTMAVLMFFTSIGYAVDMHYCKGELQNVQLFGKAKACHDAASTHCPMTGKTCPLQEKIQKEHEGGCCSNELVYLNFDVDSSQLPYVEAPSDLDNLAELPIGTYLSLFVEMYEPAKYQNYKPPLLRRDICVLVQSFLI